MEAQEQHDCCFTYDDLFIRLASQVRIANSILVAEGTTALCNSCVTYRYALHNLTTASANVLKAYHGPAKAKVQEELPTKFKLAS